MRVISLVLADKEIAQEKRDCPDFDSLSFYIIHHSASRSLSTIDFPDIARYAISGRKTPSIANIGVIIINGVIEK